MTNENGNAKTSALTVRSQLSTPPMLQALSEAIPLTARKYLTPERIVRIVQTALSRNPRLAECEPRSLLRSVVELVQLGLEPGGPLGHSYLVPYRNGKTGRYECQPIIGYQGYLALARRSGEIESITVEVICEHDEYEVVFGDNPCLMHKRRLTGDRGRWIAVYCVAKFNGGGKHIEVMTRDEVMTIKSRSRASESGPWVTDEEMMARKTVIRRARHYWPMSVELAQAAEMEDSVDAGAYVLQHGGNEETEQPKKIEAGTHKVGKRKKEAENSEAEVQAESFDFGPPPLADEEVAGQTK